MEKLGWKITAIVFICLFFSLITIISWGWIVMANDEKLLNECYYEYCADYPNAVLSADYVCSCYEYDTLGYEVIAKQKWMKS